MYTAIDESVVDGKACGIGPMAPGRSRTIKLGKHAMRPGTFAYLYTTNSPISPQSNVIAEYVA